METTPARRQLGDDLLNADQIQATVNEVIATTQFIDIHTHLFAPEFGGIGLWGIDELLTYHYLEAELFRSSSLSPERYWEMPKREQADVIWQVLFVENSPISEATRGVIAVLEAFDLPTDSPDLEEARSFFRAQKIESHVSTVLQMAGVSSVVMTNDPLHPEEEKVWMNGGHSRADFLAVLRLDRILWGWPGHWQRLAEQLRGGRPGRREIGGRGAPVSWRLVRADGPAYMAVSLTDAFQFPEDSIQGKLLSDAVLPSCREFDLPLSLMIGVRRQVNPRIRLAGDAAGRADLRSWNILPRLPRQPHSDQRPEPRNQHELCVYARKFSNLMPFGCWWFLNNPSIVEEITRERIELLGTSFIPQHSDARVLEKAHL